MEDCKLKELIEKYGNAFYVLDSVQFEKNYVELTAAFKKIYPNFNVAYSYKTNYTPKLCRIVNRLGGFAEVVSDMETEIAVKSGVPFDRIILNGPYKKEEKVEKLLISGGTVNLDSGYETAMIERTAKKYPDKTLNVGIRCNFDVNDNVLSRFGFDVDGEDFEKAVRLLKSLPNVNFIGIQCHFATRSLNTWKPRAEGMLKVIDKIGFVPERIDLGGGLFGKMGDSLKAQFDSYIPTYEEYAKEVACLFKEKFGVKNPPMLLVEPGSALVGDCMKFYASVIDIKNVRGKAIAILSGSMYNINPTLNKKNPPITVYNLGGERKEYKDLDFGGYTCIESDYLYRHFNGKLAVGDVVEFSNAGSYSVVLKPPFILPNFPIIDLAGGKVEAIKKGETFEDLFHTFSF